MIFLFNLFINCLCKAHEKLLSLRLKFQNRLFKYALVSRCAKFVANLIIKETKVRFLRFLIADINCSTPLKDILFLLYLSRKKRSFLQFLIQLHTESTMRKSCLFITINSISIKRAWRVLILLRSRIPLLRMICYFPFINHRKKWPYRS